MSTSQNDGDHMRPKANQSRTNANPACHACMLDNLYSNNPGPKAPALPVRQVWLKTKGPTKTDHLGEENANANLRNTQACREKRRCGDHPDHQANERLVNGRNSSLDRDAHRTKNQQTNNHAYMHIKASIHARGLIRASKLSLCMYIYIYRHIYIHMYIYIQL